MYVLVNTAWTSLPSSRSVPRHAFRHTGVHRHTDTDTNVCTRQHSMDLSASIKISATTCLQTHRGIQTYRHRPNVCTRQHSTDLSASIKISAMTCLQTHRYTDIQTQTLMYVLVNTAWTSLPASRSVPRHAFRHTWVHRLQTP